MKPLCRLLIALLTTFAIRTQAELWQWSPGITERGKAPDAWTLDLREKEATDAAEMAKSLSQRLYGSNVGALHHPIKIQTQFSRDKIIAFQITAVTAAGSDLILKLNGKEAGRHAWPKSEKTHRLNHILQYPLPSGSNEITLEVSVPQGVVVISRYFIADTLTELPYGTIAAPFGSSTAIAAAAEPLDFSKEPTGGHLAQDDGYRGIWYANQPSGDEYVYKYSGGFATYPQQHAPIAIYAAEVNKTFFVYGGTTARSGSDPQELLHMISYYDHTTGTVPRPRILLNKHTDDAHDNPTLLIDGQGYLWIFSPAHGTTRPSFLHRSSKPWSIDEFERVEIPAYSYPQAWYESDRGILLLHTRYHGGRTLGNQAIRCLFWSHSPDGRQWEELHFLAGIEMGSYGVSWSDGHRTALTFDFHPSPVGLNARSNLYYIETRDAGGTWTTVDGRAISPPLTSSGNIALVYDSQKDGRLVYIKDLNFDADGRPVVLLLTTRGYESGPANGSREWFTVRWDGHGWIRHLFTQSDSNYDHGSLYIEPGGVWRVIAPTDPGPQAFNPGGQMVLWTSTDRGVTWTRVKQLTHDEHRNHTYARRPLHAHPDFYALWADGDARVSSASSLYFTDQNGSHVWRLPSQMSEELSKPEIAW